MDRSFILTVTFALIALTGTAALGQSPQSYYEKGKLTEMSDLLSGDELEGCSAEPKRVAGTVTAVRFTEGRIIGNFTLRTTARQNVKIEISPSAYKRMSKKDAAALPTLIARTRRITVDMHTCGSARRALYVIAGIRTEMLG